MIVPSRLRPGDTVAVVSPAGPVDPVRLARAARVLRGFGLEVTIGPHAHDRTGYLAGTDEDRAADLQRAWCDPSVRAVLCSRGGYGTTRLLDLLDWEKLASARPKPLVGSSDITGLHAAFGAKLGVATCFAPMTEGLLDPRNAEGYGDALFTGRRAAPIKGTRVLAPGRAEGRLVGGNLSLVAAVAGTPYGLRADGCVLLLEDINEQPYRVDRMLTQLLQAGVLDGVAGIALGSWVECGPEDELMELFADRLGGLGVPIIAGLPIGHGAAQCSVWLGGLCRLETDSFSLTCLFRDPAEPS